jgi:acetyl esterase/lipase
MNDLRGALESSTTDASPLINFYPAKKPTPSGMGLLIFPGGGYGGLADYEGEGYARYFADRGVNCFVVNYRLGTQDFHHPAMLEDALAALATVRSRAMELGVNPDLIGVMGSSAGGHLAAHAMVGYDHYRSSVSLRPDFGVLCYPVISMGDEIGHRGSRDMLLGPDPSADIVRECSCELHVNARTPPCFLWHTREDQVVPFHNSSRFADALHAAGVAFELHIFDKGPHGLGQDLTHPWAANCHHWLSGLAAR